MGLTSVNPQVVQAYQAGVAALRLSLRDVTVERAENLVDQIQEVLLLLLLPPPPSLLFRL